MIATTVLVLILTIILIGGFTRAGAWDRNCVPDVAMGLPGWFLVNAIALMLFPAPTTDIFLPTEIFNFVFIRHL
jgi:hypothetical protein